MKTCHELKQFSRQMRRTKATSAERVFRKRLEQARIHHVAQCIIGFYIADVVVPHRMTIVELDGSSHAGREGYDAKRDAFLRSLGFRVLRVDNRDAQFVSLNSLVAREGDTIRAFRSALGRANNERSKAIRADRERATNAATLERLRTEVRALDEQAALSVARDV